MAKAMGRRGQKDQREVTANMANMATTFAHNAHFIKKIANITAASWFQFVYLRLHHATCAKYEHPILFLLLRFQTLPNEQQTQGLSATSPK